jgi:hypothetical protein
MKRTYSKCDQALAEEPHPAHLWVGLFGGTHQCYGVPSEQDRRIRNSSRCAFGNCVCAVNHDHREACPDCLGEPFEGEVGW